MVGRQQAEEEELAVAIARSLGQDAPSPASGGSATVSGGGGGGAGADGVSMALVDEVLPSMPFADARGFLVDGSTDGDGGVPECSICLAELAAEARVRVLPCVHVYHVHCIDNWFRRAAACPSCPTCKAPVAIG